MTDVGNVKKDFKAAMVKMCQQQFGIHLEQMEKSRIRCLSKEIEDTKGKSNGHFRGRKYSN